VLHAVAGRELALRQHLALGIQRSEPVLRRRKRDARATAVALHPRLAGPWQGLPGQLLPRELLAM